MFLYNRVMPVKRKTQTKIAYELVDLRLVVVCLLVSVLSACVSNPVESFNAATDTTEARCVYEGVLDEPVGLLKSLDNKRVLAALDTLTTRHNSTCVAIDTTSYAILEASNHAPSKLSDPAAAKRCASQLELITAPTPVLSSKNKPIAYVFWGYSPSLRVCYLTLDQKSAAVLWAADKQNNHNPVSDANKSTLWPTKISVGGQHSHHICSVSYQWALTCEGSNFAGQAAPPIKTGFIDVGAGGAHSCGVRISLRLVCWGANAYGQATPPLGTYKSVALGAKHSCALLLNGAAKCWGLYSDIHQPPDTLFKQITLGGYHACGLSVKGDISCWGQNNSNQLIAPNGYHKQVSSGWYHVCALTWNNKAVCWGDNTHQQASPPADTFRSLAAGGEHTCGITVSNTVKCWGNNYAKQATPPADEFKQLASKEDSTCGITIDNTIKCWGL